jgi:hypothetical protein
MHGGIAGLQRGIVPLAARCTLFGREGLAAGRRVGAWEYGMGLVVMGMMSVSRERCLAGEKGTRAFLTAAVNYVTPDMDGFGHGVRELDLGI